MEEIFLFSFSCWFENSPEAGYVSQELNCLKVPVHMYQLVTSPLCTSVSFLILVGILGKATSTGIPTQAVDLLCLILAKTCCSVGSECATSCPL